MTREEAITLIDELQVCIKEHPIIADWLVEIANRKTENSSEISNNCKLQTKCENNTIEKISHDCIGLCNIKEKRKHCDLIKTKPQTERSE